MLHVFVCVYAINTYRRHVPQRCTRANGWAQRHASAMVHKGRGHECRANDSSQCHATQADGKPVCEEVEENLAARGTVSSEEPPERLEGTPRTPEADAGRYETH